MINLLTANVVKWIQFNRIIILHYIFIWYLILLNYILFPKSPFINAVRMHANTNERGSMKFPRLISICITYTQHSYKWLFRCGINIKNQFTVKPRWYLFGVWTCFCALKFCGSTQPNSINETGINLLEIILLLITTCNHIIYNEWWFTCATWNDFTFHKKV